MTREREKSARQGRPDGESSHTEGPARNPGSLEMEVFEWVLENEDTGLPQDPWHKKELKKQRMDFARPALIYIARIQAGTIAWTALQDLASDMAAGQSLLTLQIKEELPETDEKVIRAKKVRDRVFNRIAARKQDPDYATALTLAQIRVQAQWKMAVGGGGNNSGELLHKTLDRIAAAREFEASS